MRILTTNFYLFLTNPSYTKYASKHMHVLLFVQNFFLGISHCKFVHKYLSNLDFL